MQEQPELDQELFQTCMSVLKYHVGVLCLTKTDYQYSKMLIDKVVRLMCLLRPDLNEKWMIEKEKHLKDRAELEEKTEKELKDCVKELKESLAEKGLLEILTIKQRLCIIEAIFKHKLEELSGSMCSNCGALREKHRIPVIPSYVHSVHDLIKSLCYEILDRGHWDVLLKYARVMCSKQYDSGSKTGFYVKYEIDSFTIARSFYAMLELDEILVWHNRDKDTVPAWVAWDTLLSIQWGIKGPRDYLRKKSLNYDDPKECSRSTYLLYLHGLRAEAKAIKNKRQSRNKVTFFKREHVDKVLKVILKEMWLSIIDGKLEDEDLLPHVIELDLKDNDIQLLLKIEWAPGIVEICHMHSFQERDSLDPKIREVRNTRYDFIKNLLDNPGKLQEISPALILEGGNAKQFLNKMGIDGILFQLFFDGNVTRYGAILHKKCIPLKGVSKETLKQLRAYIQKLEHVKWLDNQSKI